MRQRPAGGGGGRAAAEAVGEAPPQMPQSDDDDTSTQPPRQQQLQPRQRPAQLERQYERQEAAGAAEEEGDDVGEVSIDSEMALVLRRAEEAVGSSYRQQRHRTQHTHPQRTPVRHSGGGGSERRAIHYRRTGADVGRRLDEPPISVHEGLPPACDSVRRRRQHYTHDTDEFYGR